MYANLHGCVCTVARECCFLCLLLMWPSYLAGFILANALAGQDQMCSNEGGYVYVPLVAGNPCYKCFCRKSRVECETNQCPSLEGCHAITFIRPRGHCCDVCKGCTVDGFKMASGDVWANDEDPCNIRTCQAGVVTSSRELCRPPCQNPVMVPGQCCPSCSGCYYNGIDYRSGQIFNLDQDPSVQCVCKGGNVTCSKKACPVLNCREEMVYHDMGENCPKCKGQRMVFDTPKSCFFSKSVFHNGVMHVVDSCTSCVCREGTMLCDRQLCPEITCPPKDQEIIPGTCCVSCRKKLHCHIGGVTRKDGEIWQTDQCTTCTCRDGVSHCESRKCTRSVIACPQDYSWSYKDDQCCPVCIRKDGICSLRGQTSNQVKTFDKRGYNIDGFCTHDLVRDCGQGQLTVKIKYKTKGNFGKQIDLVTIRFDSTRIKLYRNSKIRINRTSLFPSQVTSKNFSIKFRSSRIILKIKLGLSVHWNLNDSLIVKVSNKFFKSDRLCGLCGNFDGNITNDLQNKKGGQLVDSSHMAHIWVRGKLCRHNSETKYTNSTNNSLVTLKHYKKQYRNSRDSNFQKKRFGTKANLKDTPKDIIKDDSIRNKKYAVSKDYFEHSALKYFLPVNYNVKGVVTVPKVSTTDPATTFVSESINDVATEEIDNIKTAKYNRKIQRNILGTVTEENKVLHTDVKLGKNISDSISNFEKVTSYNANIKGHTFDTATGGENVISYNVTTVRVYKLNDNITVTARDVINNENIDKVTTNMNVNIDNKGKICQENTFQWNKTMDYCQKLKIIKLEHCGDVSADVSVTFVRLCIQDLCACSGDEICKDTFLAYYLFPCNLTSRSTPHSILRTSLNTTFQGIT